MRKRIDEAKLRADIKREVFGEIADALENADSPNDAAIALVQPDMALPSVSDIRGWTPEQINERWDDVAIVMQQTGGRPDPRFDNEATVTAPKATGQQPLNHDVGREFTPMSMESIKRMSVSQYEQHRTEVDAFIARGGRAA